MQVDRALENALKYGIFEVKNNRYRVRDNVLDDVDTVYWKMQKLREQTPFHVQGTISHFKNEIFFKIFIYVYNLLYIQMIDNYDKI